MIKRYKQTEIEKLAEILKNDGAISVPTDTVYGVCARINSKKAHDNLVKGSTIVDCVSKELKILRDGPITIEQIREVLNG